MGDARDDSILTFCHTAKTAGTTLQLLLRRHFGIRHLDLPRGDPYTATRLRWELRLNPLVRSIAGHSLRPHVDFGPYEDRLRWFTFLREPISRYISHYQHSVEKHANKATFEAYLKDPTRWNWHVRMLAGEEDLEAAKQMLATKIRCVGLTEHFDESLLLIRHRMKLEDFVVAYGRPRNPARTSEVRRRILEAFDTYRDEICERNRLDLELYGYAVQELYSRQRQEYGEARLRHDLETEFTERNATFSEQFRYYQCVGFRKMFFLPIINLRRKVGGRALGRAK